ncbi:sigma-54 interaction domain-containing protein [Fusibacter ferrireducens]|uniref:Sigma 54-interacting transcriptional regulator n=1 Tax=Fusibacter ferrireducens TaxID=2785058 RepID=A0ABR9ZW74_9FIRM|nr:sigma 54-interacting transcriptional regulator [Fusibacter ferrireducens]MBF4694694.1 sigma 54-interacting transcriptional regulator [Fusibacter ferrireducens]
MNTEILKAIGFVISNMTNQTTMVFDVDFNCIYGSNILPDDLALPVKGHRIYHFKFIDRSITQYQLFFSDKIVGYLYTCQLIRADDLEENMISEFVLSLLAYIQNSLKRQSNSLFFISNKYELLCYETETDIFYYNHNSKQLLDTYTSLTKHLQEKLTLHLKTAHDELGQNESIDPHNKKAFKNISEFIFKSENVKITIVLTAPLFDLLKIFEIYDNLSNCFTFEGILGKSISIHHTIEKAKKIARSNSTVLITGESGTGKELFARAIHYESKRAKAPFIPVNCAAIPDTLLESELFGYEAGSFTGALKTGKIGKFELAHGGSIFLDEIGDMPLHLQSKLLRVLQDRCIEKIGATNPIPIDVRVISATNKELHQRVDLGNFREDLFYRLSVIPLKLPALRDRKVDIIHIANYYLLEYCAEFSDVPKYFDDAVKDLFLNYFWPGNIREIKNVVEYAAVMCPDPCITTQYLPERFSNKSHRQRELFGNFVSEQHIQKLADLERAEIIKAIQYYNFSKEKIPQMIADLGISKATFYRRLRDYDIQL